MSISTVGEKGGLQRPYTHGSFQQRLNDFDDLIKELTLQDVEATPEERRQMITENLRFDQFCDSIRALFGADIHNQDLKALYRKISTNPDAKVDWSELFGYFHSDADDQEFTGSDDTSVFMVTARRRVGDAAGDRKRRDTVQCIRYIPSMDCYLTASQKGAISLWTSKLRLQACTDINESAWVTGCEYLSGLRRVATCTERAIAVWDNRAKGKTQSVFTIKPIEHSPQCLEWVPWPYLNPQEDAVLFGDDQGYVNLLILSGKDLTMKNSKGDTKRYSGNYVIDPNKLSTPIRRRRLHDDWVLKIKYFPELRCFASCSPSSTSSLVLEEVQRITDDGEVRGVSIPKGVNAFDYCARANIIATGGVDKVIRVWHPHIFSRPTGKLIGHLFTIVDIACNEKDQHLISLSTARVFRIWDIHTLTSLQVFTDNEERPGEKRIYSMLFDNKHERLLTGSSVLDAWPLTRSVQDTMQVPHTHDRPISHVLHNRELKQIITVCTESLLRVWETETGKLVYQLLEPHGTNTEVTALAIDKSGYRLTTGAAGGSVKVWDFGSGQEIKSKMGKPGDEEATVLGLQFCTMDGERCIIAIGWGNHLQILLDSNDNFDLPVLKEFTDVMYRGRDEILSPSSGRFSSHEPLPDIGTPRSVHPITQEYVLSNNELTCMDVLEPNLLATGCTNGNIIFWDFQRSAVNRIAVLPDPLDESINSSPSSQSSRRKPADNARAVNAIAFLVHRVSKLDPAFIKKLASSDSDDEDDEVDADVDGDGEAAAEVEAEAAPAVDGPPSQQGSRGGTAQTTGETEVTKPDEITGQPETNGQGPRVTFDVSDATNDATQRAGAEGGEGNPQEADSKLIVDTFPAVLVSGHQDAFLRFWSAEGKLLREISAMTRRQASAVTALCHDHDANIMISGDQRGYLTLWNISKFLENPTSKNKDLVKQMLCWRAHLTKIVQVAYIDAQQAIISGSTDGSVRIWWGFKGRFIGFYGQHRPVTFPVSEEKASTPVLPYDITEGPLAPVKSVSARTQIKAQQKFEYPLVFDNNKWEACPRRSAAIMRTEPTKKSSHLEGKFFQSLVKPRAYRDHLESFTTGEMRSGAVFRALPVYRVRTPEKPRMPAISYPRGEEEESPPFMLAGYKKDAKANKNSSKAPSDKELDKGKSKKTSRAMGPSSSPTNPPSPRRR